MAGTEDEFVNVESEKEKLMSQGKELLRQLQTENDALSKTYENLKNAVSVANLTELLTSMEQNLKTFEEEFEDLKSKMENSPEYAPNYFNALPAVSYLEEERVKMKKMIYIVELEIKVKRKKEEKEILENRNK